MGSRDKFRFTLKQVFDEVPISGYFYDNMNFCITHGPRTGNFAHWLSWMDEVKMEWCFFEKERDDMRHQLSIIEADAWNYFTSGPMTATEVERRRENLRPFISDETKKEIVDIVLNAIINKQCEGCVELEAKVVELKKEINHLKHLRMKDVQRTSESRKDTYSFSIYNVPSGYKRSTCTVDGYFNADMTLQIKYGIMPGLWSDYGSWISAVERFAGRDIADFCLLEIRKKIIDVVNYFDDMEDKANGWFKNPDGTYVRKIKQ